ncbi:M15 family metallopeptidase [Mycobacterium sp. SMC-4]|uniref:M15 family metallopeptidase n=1 Tax=Mycobacterium sp. SMC-4 TaxID=2857059 RepID=UPI0021B4CE6A|nr:M15 family metallopeptidase [Mycobacterium sp. SMC-4]UXA16839.1 M15 family metallopeptidase [Mycobacterium sp. SMC-4]
MTSWSTGLRVIAAGAMLGLTGCGQSPPVALMQTTIPLPPAPTVEMPAPAADPLTIGPAAVDTTGGYLPEGVMLSPFDDVANPALALLDPALLRAVQDAAREAEAAGIPLRITSGWRSVGFQQRLFDDAVRTYGSVEQAAQLVATPEASKHVTGQAVDIGPVQASQWMLANGSRFGLCQIYANEIWHYELFPQGCPPLRANAAG